MHHENALSTDDKKDVRDRFLKQRADMRRQAILLESELRTAGESLVHVGGLLNNMLSGKGKTEKYVVTLNAMANAPEICGLSRIAATVVELHKTRELLDDFDRVARGPDS